MSLRWLPASEGATAERTWKALEARVGDRGLASSWTWTGTWLEHYGDLVPHRFAVADADEAACAIALVTSGLARRHGPFRVRSLHLGTAGEPADESVFVECNEVLADRKHRAGFAAALLEDLRHDPDWHELSLDGFAPKEAEPFLAAEPRLDARLEICPTTELRRADTTNGDVLRTLGKNTRTMVRRSLRGLGDVETEWAETPEQALEILEELIVLHQARWTRAAQPGAFASPRFRAFHRALVPRLAASGGVILFRARTARGTVGCIYAFVDRGRVLVYQTGFASHPDNQVRPGFVSHVTCMQACYERGLEEYDFLAGDSVYKRQLSTGARELLWATWRRPALRWRLVDELAKLKRRARAPWAVP